MDEPNWFEAGLLTNLISSLIWLILAFLVGKVNQYLSRHTKLGIPVKLLIVSLFMFVGLALSLALGSPVLVMVVGALTVALGWWSLKGLFRIGLIDAFSKTSLGITPGASLKLANESIEFLGIGANKLTSDPGFEAAIRRCSRGGAVGACRFLLSQPSNQLLEKLATRNGTNTGDYSDKVLESLKIFARLKLEKQLNLEVRFYKEENRSEFQQFRLMFINNHLCLASWTVWDDKLGMNNPQLILRQSSGSDDKKTTLFKAFKDHFEETWESGELVNLEDYL